MPRRKRVVVVGVSHHITHRGNGGADLFRDNYERRFYLNTLADNAIRYGMEIEAYCLMLNHVHLIAVPRALDSLTLAIGRTHHAHARLLNERDDRTGHVWKSRFYSTPMSRSHRHRAIRYGERNPVRAGIVAQAWEYEWSSAPAHCGLSPAHRILLPNRIAAPPAQWQEHLRVPVRDHHADAIRLYTRAGSPLGSDRFIAELETQTALVLGPRPACKSCQHVTEVVRA